MPRWAYRSDVQITWLAPVSWGRGLAARTTAPAAALIIGGLGTLAVFLVSLPMGFLAKSLEDSVDWPAFRWIHPRVHDSPFTSAMNLLTKMGNIFEIRVICVVGALLLGLAWRRRFYIPPIVILSTFLLEKFSQKLLAKIVDRGHPPTTLGTFPSGGCARLLTIYGVMLFLGLLVMPTLARKWKFTAWTVLTVAAWLEAFSRTYLSKHWLTDAVAGLIFGALLLLVVISATAALTRTVVPFRADHSGTEPDGLKVIPSGSVGHADQ
ncbi:MAG: phosphatase PAP2 family protein [Jatrophihabitans sp.]